MSAASGEIGHCQLVQNAEGLLSNLVSSNAETCRYPSVSWCQFCSNCEDGEPRIVTGMC
jgi:hypothetical protein